MVNRFTFALAVALFLGIPLGAAGPGGVGADTHVVAELTNVEGVPLSVASAGDAAAAGPVTAHVTEGHTVFALVEAVRPSPDVAFQVVGHVACRYVVGPLTLETPAALHPRGSACAPGGSVLFTASGTPLPPSRDALTPTGWERVVHAPDTGRPVLVTEHRYPSPGGDGDAYAWETEILDARVNPKTGNAFNFVGAVNAAHLHATGAARFNVWTDDAFR